MNTPAYRCPLTAQIYPVGTKITFHVNGEPGRARVGVIMQSADGSWKVIAKSRTGGKNGEIFLIDTKGRAAAPQSIKRALA